MGTPLQDWAVEVNRISTAHGFWPKEGRNFGEMIALAHSELSEALEEHRDGKPVVYWKCKTCGWSTTSESGVGIMHQVPRQGVWWRMLAAMRFKFTPGMLDCDERDGGMKPEGAAVELMDAMIRLEDTLFDTLKRTGYTIDDIKDIKMAYNDGREFMHGRKY